MSSIPCKDKLEKLTSLSLSPPLFSFSFSSDTISNNCVCHSVRNVLDFFENLFEIFVSDFLFFRIFVLSSKQFHDPYPILVGNHLKYFFCDKVFTKFCCNDFLGDNVFTLLLLKRVHEIKDI